MESSTVKAPWKLKLTKEWLKPDNIVSEQNRNPTGSKGKSDQKNYQTNTDTFMRIMKHKRKTEKQNEQHRNEITKKNKK